MSGELTAEFIAGESSEYLLLFGSYDGFNFFILF